MSILAELLLATPADAEAYADEPTAPPRDGVERAQFGGLLDIHFGILWALLEGRPWDDTRDALEEASIPPDGTSWLFRFPDAFVARLAALDDARAAELTARWAADQDVAANPRDIAPVMDALRRMAKETGAGGRSLYLWGSL